MIKIEEIESQPDTLYIFFFFLPDEAYFSERRLSDTNQCSLHFLHRLVSISSMKYSQNLLEHSVRIWSLISKIY